MKKTLAVFLVMTMTAAMLAACGSVHSADKETKRIESADDLEGAKIGVQTDTTGDIYVTDDYGDEHVERFNKGYEAVQALAQGKIDAVVIDDQPAQAFIEEIEGLKIIEAPYVEEDYAMCFKKGNEKVAEFNKAIQKLKDDGTFDQIVTYYIEGKGDRYQSPENVDRSKGKLVMATNAEFPPYEFREDQEIVGIDIDFAQAICDMLGYELKIKNMDFGAIIPAVQSGKADFGAAGITVTDERKEQIDFSEKYYTGILVIIINDNIHD